MKLGGLNIYPLKSGAPIALEHASLVDTGLLHDRRFMLVDGQGDFVTLRGYPKLVTVGAEISSDHVVFTVAGERLEVPLESAGEDFREQRSVASGEQQVVPVQIWGDYVDAVQVSAAADSLFSKFLGKRVRLMRFDRPERRQVDPGYAEPGDSVHFADGFPLLVCGTASLAALSEWLGADVSMSRFRPNVVVETDVPFIEDAWQTIRVGDIPMDIVKPCARCVGVNADPDSGRVTKEPLATLAKFRTQDQKVMFGQNAIHRAMGVLRVGDPVVVER